MLDIKIKDVCTTHTYEISGDKIHCYCSKCGKLDDTYIYPYV